MYLTNARKERFEEVELLGVPALFTTLRVDRATVPPGMYAYDLQTSPEDWAQPGLLGRHITVDHMGTVLTATPIELNADGYREMAPGEFSFAASGGVLTVEAFQEKYLSPAPRRPAPRRSSPARAR